MSEDSRKKLDNVIRIDEGQIRGHLDQLVRSTVEETLKGLLDAEADRLCGAERYQRSEGRRDYRSGYYERGLARQASIQSCGMHASQIKYTSQFQDTPLAPIHYARLRVRFSHLAVAVRLPEQVPGKAPSSCANQANVRHDYCRQ